MGRMIASTVPCTGMPFAGAGPGLTSAGQGDGSNLWHRGAAGRTRNALQPAARYLVLIDSAADGRRLARLFLSSFEQVAEFDAAERHAAQVYTLAL
jgi:hypothetical protein